MKLILMNGYPHPYPVNATRQEQDVIADNAKSHQFELSHVIHFEWLHTVTVEFEHDPDVIADARRRTGWNDWSAYVLEAPTSVRDGYGHPAIIVGNTAYCGFVLMN